MRVDAAALPLPCSAAPARLPHKQRGRQGAKGNGQAASTLTRGPDKQGDKQVAEGEEEGFKEQQALGVLRAQHCVSLADLRGSSGAGA